MRALTDAEVVEVWERGVCQHPLDRALTILCACSPDSREEMARVSVGRRDAALLALYRRLAGETLEAFTECPACAERLEYSLAAGDLTAVDHERETELTMTTGEFWLQLRLVNSTDLAAVAGGCDADDAGRMLAERCIVEARSGGVTVAAADLPEDVIEEAGARLAKADPQAETIIDLTCAACAHNWQVILDIESFLWAKINALARRILRDVHVLASVYGWPEAGILAMSPARRQFYLEMVS